MTLHGVDSTLQTYGSGGSSAGVSAFVVLSDSLILLFQDGSAYLYTGDTPGPGHVRRMIALALRGSGLTTYVNRHVRSSYAQRLSPQQVSALRESVNPAPEASASSRP